MSSKKPASAPANEKEKKARGGGPQSGRDKTKKARGGGPQSGRDKTKKAS